MGIGLRTEHFMSDNPVLPLNPNLLIHESYRKKHGKPHGPQQLEPEIMVGAPDRKRQDKVEYGPGDKEAVDLLPLHLSASWYKFISEQDSHIEHTQHSTAYEDGDEWSLCDHEKDEDRGEK